MTGHIRPRGKEASEIGGWKALRGRWLEISGRRLPVTMILHSTGNSVPVRRFGCLHFEALSLVRASATFPSLRPPRRRRWRRASFLFPQRRRRCCSYASVPFPGRFEMSAASDVPDEDRSRDRLIGFRVVPAAAFRLSSLLVRLRD